MATNLRWDSLSPDETLSAKGEAYRLETKCGRDARLKLSSLAFCLLLREPCLKVND